MAVLTGASGALKYRGAKVGKVREWSITINRDSLEDTCIGVNDRTYIAGIRGSNGSATVFYEPSDGAAKTLLNSIFEDDDRTSSIELVLNQQDATQFACSAFVTSVGHTVSVGELQATSLNFQVSGPIGGQF